MRMSNRSSLSLMMVRVHAYLYSSLMMVRVHAYLYSSLMMVRVHAYLYSSLMMVRVHAYLYLFHNCGSLCPLTLILFHMEHVLAWNCHPRSLSTSTAELGSTRACRTVLALRLSSPLRRMYTQVLAVIVVCCSFHDARACMSDSDVMTHLSTCVSVSAIVAGDYASTPLTLSSLYRCCYVSVDRRRP